MTEVDFYTISQNQLVIKNLFNEEHAAEVLKEIKAYDLTQTQVIVWNVGVKIMKELFESLESSRITDLHIHYDWDQIMLNPKLVSWDKMSWKTLQQLSNWNKTWSEMLAPLYSVRKLRMELRCSWFNEGFLESIVGSIERLNGLDETVIIIQSKDMRVEKYLEENQKNNRLNNFSYVVEKWTDTKK